MLAWYLLKRGVSCRENGTYGREFWKNTNFFVDFFKYCVKELFVFSKKYM